MMSRNFSRVLPIAVWAMVLALVACGPAQDAAPLTLVKAGKAQLPIVAGSVPEPAAELQTYLERITKARFETARPAKGQAGIHVGLVTDFPWLAIDKPAELGPEGFVIKTEGNSLYLVAHQPRGVQHAVSSFLHGLGCRWFFPGKTWEVIPARATIAGAWNERSVPAFAVQRRIHYGFGAYKDCARDLADWERHNRMGGPVQVSIGHTWHGLNPDKEFATHPEWFALVDGKRQANKPCYSHPDVIKRASEHALALAEKGAAMVSMTPPDGLGYCECEHCRAVFKGAEPYKEQSTLFARRPDGVVVNITSENLFALVNKVAEAVAAKHPDVLIGCYAYSAYSHPPSFKLHKNVFLQTTTAYRRTPLSLAEQLDLFKERGARAGIRGYFSVYQWDWDYPSIKGELSMPRLVNDLRLYAKHNVQSVNAEASNNWAPRGPGYYLSARLMWNVDEDPKAILADFYDKAFGPAAVPMERYYVRWLGSYAAVRTKPAKADSKPDADKKPDVDDELGADTTPPASFDRESLQAAYRDLDEAAKLAKDDPACLARVDHLRLYAHYLFLRLQLDEAAKTKDRDKIRQAVENETTFGSRLTYTNLIHTRPLVGKEFFRRFSKHGKYLEGIPEWPASNRDAVTKASNQGYRRVRTDIPDHAELEKLWAADKQALGL
ncbi:MAG: DUF4838 domain-containing protein [Gemmataceae bacterium]